MSLTTLVGGFPLWFYVALALPLVLNFWAITHAFYREFPTIQEKMVWLCLVVFVPVAGALIYLFAGKKRGKSIK
ncbi:MAG: PLDc N-terminal domain-containing protein [Acidobacteriota bacterium]